jgi:hypothetical protein
MWQAPVCKQRPLIYQCGPEMKVLMAAPKGNKFALGGNGGRPSKYKAHYAAQARKAREAGFTDKELADLFGVSRSTINLWKLENENFRTP